MNSFAVTTDSEGNVYSTGYFDGTADLDPGDGTFQMTVMGYSDAFVRKLDSSGNFIWVKQLGGSQGSVGHSIGVDSNGNVYTTGTFATTVDFDPGEDTFILESEDEQSMYLSKLDSSGSFQWAKNMGGDVGYSLIVDQSDDIYVTGYYGWDDIFINKLNPVGNLLWEKQIGAFVCYSLEVDEQGNIYTIGQFYETGDFNPGPDVYELTAIGSSDSYINMLDSSGNFMWVKQIGGTDEVLSRSLAMDSNGALLTAGTFNGTADFDPGPATSELTSSGSYDIFLQKLEPSGVSVSENSFSKDVKVYPNPTDGKVTVEFTEMQAELDIIVTNSVGQIVKTESMKRGTRTEFQIKGASGVYFLEILNQDKQNAIFRVLKN